MVEVAVAQDLAHALDPWLLAAAYLGVDLRDVEDIDADFTKQLTAGDVLLLVVVAGNDPRCID
ncbi:hypothetical protein D9M68_996140 [compost metagenome]